VLPCRYEERQKAREDREAARQDEHKAATGDIGVEPFSAEASLAYGRQPCLATDTISVLNPAHDHALPAAHHLPWDSVAPQIFTCEQLLTYLRSFTAVKEEVKEEVKAVEVPKGLKPLQKKVLEDEMFTGVPKKAPAGKGKVSQPLCTREPIGLPVVKGWAAGSSCTSSTHA
jgi:hypothetical protein